MVMFCNSKTSPYARSMSEYQSLGWQDKAKCKETDPEAFFVGDIVDSATRRNLATAEATKVCGACAVKLECLEYALKTSQEHGIWGGLTTKERNKLKRAARHPTQSGV